MKTSCQKNCRCSSVPIPPPPACWILLLLTAISVALPFDRTAIADDASVPGVEATPSGEVLRIRGRLRELSEEKPLRSSDGLVVVSGKSAAAADKLIILSFVQDVRERLERLLITDLSTSPFAVFVYLDESHANSVLYSLVVETSYKERIFVSVENVTNLDSRDLASKLCAAWLAVDAVERGYPADDGPIKSPYPEWFANGIAGLLGSAERQSDIEKVLALWQSAKLPDARILLADPSAITYFDNSVATVLASWILDAPDRGGRWSAIRDRFVLGDEWTPETLAVILGLGPSASALDPALSKWLLERRWHVSTIGSTPSEFITRFRAQLDIRPGTPGLPITSFNGEDLISPSEAIKFKDFVWMPAAAERKADDISRFGLGRSAEFREVASSWRAFFYELQNRASDKKLEKLRADAEYKLDQIERTTAASSLRIKDIYK